MRKFLTLLVVVLLIVFAFTGCNKDDDKVLHLYNWTYYTPDSIIEQFEEETGYKVVIDNFSSNEEMFAKLTAGGGSGYDIIFPSADYTSIMIKLNMVQKLDHSLMPNLQYVSPLVKEKATYDPNMDYAVPYFMGAAGIAVNTEKVPADYSRDWSIFADTRIAGKMSMLDDMREVMGDALKTLGYSVNTSNEAEIAEAARIVNYEWKPNLVKFDAESFGKAFSRGEFVVVHGYQENVIEELTEAQLEKVDFFLPPGGGSMYVDNMVIPNGAKNVEAAHAFINFIHQPDIYAIFLDEFYFPPTTNTHAAQYMETTPLYTADDMVNYEILDDLGESLEIYNTFWQDIRYKD